METEKELIINLLKQDLKHSQLIYGLEKLGFEDNGVHSLQVFEMVARLMKVPEGEVGDQWAQTYLSFMREATKYPITDLGEDLNPLAERCYNLLVACQEIDKRTQD